MLVTLSYPYHIGKEDTFLSKEVKYYKGNFKSVTILPNYISDTADSLDPFLEIDDALIKYTRNHIKFPDLLWRAFDNPAFLISELAGAGKDKKKVNLKKAVKDYLMAMSYLKFFTTYFSNKKDCDYMIYTYWFTPVTTAAALFAKNNTGIKVMSRAHGIDLYEYRNKNYIPFRKKTIKLLDKLVLVSVFGKKYVEDTYAISKSKLATFGIGTADPGFMCEKSSGNRLRVVSCSGIDENKRVDLIILGLQKFKAQHPDMAITWNHFGAGSMMDTVLKMAKENLQDQVNFKFWGQVSNDALIEFYKTNPVDGFITTSASEGGRPVSVMEAMSCGIPVIGTAVGGIPELVNETNGVLLSSEPDAEEIAVAFSVCINDHITIDSKKNTSAKKWKATCDARFIFPEFISFLKTI